MFSGYSQPKKTNYTLNITVTNFANTEGVLRVCITDQKDDFLDGCLFSKIISIEGETVSLSFESLKEGVYAVSVYHDENNNGVLETSGLFGFPVSLLGFQKTRRWHLALLLLKKALSKLTLIKTLLLN